MNAWLDIALVAFALVASAAYAIYALGPRRIKSLYSRFATKHFGLRAAKWFAPKLDSACDQCASRDEHQPGR
jgi:hypothetical protein